ncbi:MAG: amino acid adenylation domain-containing protein [Chloroflexi bacterium]|nr:amino acid adenylation domain-containing protein [Chloroflexota bacterium]
MMQPNVTEGFRLSPQQRRLWSLHHDAPDAYFVQGSVQITGPLDRAALDSAVRQVVARHEILRTSFQRLPGMKLPVQVIADKPELEIAYHDLSAANSSEQQASIEALLTELRAPSLDDSESLLRLALITLDRQLHALLISFPALCGDATTLKNLVHELGAAYTDSIADLDDEPMQYADFAEWQHSVLEEGGEVSPIVGLSQSDLATLRGLKLPLEQASTTPFTPRSTPVPLTPESVERLAAFASQHEIAESVVLLSAFNALLWRLTQQGELIVGVGFDGRGYDDLQAALGLFAKTLPIRTRLDAQTTFGALVAQLAQSVGEAGEAQDEFFWERIDPSAGSAPVFFPLSFELTELSTPDANTQFALTRLDSCIDRFMLKLAATHRHDALDLALHYDAARFTEETIAGFAAMLQSLLDHALAQPEQPIAALPLLSNDERQRLLHSFNATQTDYPSDRAFGELFEQQAARTPDAIAVSFGAGTRERVTLTYAELNARANQLARHLGTLGIGTQDEPRIGVYLTRSLDLLVASLAILKAGGVYLPLDPAFPQSHLATILSDSQARVILTNATLAETLPEHSAALVRLDRDWPLIAQAETSNFDGTLQPSSAAYVIYTSGSTGQPKGVVVEHRSLVNYLSWVNGRLLGGGDCQLPAVTRLTFDASLKQLFAPLLRGAEVWLLDDDMLNEPETLLNALATRSNVALNCVPSLWTTLLDIASPSQLAQLDQRLTQLLVGGEQLTPELVTRTLAALPRLQIWNLYGPTETTANASAARITAADTITIGTPLANTQIYLLDSQLQPVPIGVTGNLYVGGVSVARGYLNRPDTTAERFIPDPFSETAGSRLYHTGDLARYRADGAIEFGGRSDFQVKLRGLRIELGAIEAALKRHPSVRESVVVVRDENLVAYVVPEKNQERRTQNLQDKSEAGSRFLVLGSADLREHVGAQLPAYMVPALIVTLDALPLTPNGKLDRAALPAPGSARPAQTREFVAPRNAIEAALASIWAEVLDLDQVGVHDNFFALGGHSLLATRLAARVRKIFRVELPLRALFDVATIAELAAQLVARESKPGQVAKIADLLQQIQAMPAEEVSETLHNKRSVSGEEGSN